MVLPEQDTVIAITAETGDMQGELNVVWDQLLNKLGNKPLPENGEAVQDMRKLVDNLRVKGKKPAK